MHLAVEPILVENSAIYIIHVALFHVKQHKINYQIMAIKVKIHLVSIIIILFWSIFVPLTWTLKIKF